MSHEFPSEDDEYVRFMEELQRFHDRKGTALQPEQILGGKRLNLLTIYKSVIAAGGYDQVSNSRLWKQIGEQFNFPSTCTNSAYILKAVYTRNLLGWEREMHWKQHWTPPQDQVKGKGGSPSTTVKPRDEARLTSTALTQSSQKPRMTQPRSSANMGTILGSPAHIDEEFRSRITLALQSTLPNEVDWVFNTLIRFSFGSETFCLDYMPSLVDHLLNFVEPFFSQYVRPEVENDTCDYLMHQLFSSRVDQEKFERTLQVFHILRNFSFLDNNIRLLAHHQRLRRYLMIGISLSSSSQYAELTRHCLDILENISPQVIVTSADDPYLVAMSSLLQSNDRALILGAIRSLTRVAVTEVNERVLCIPKTDLMERLFQFLLVDDEELTAATLEYLYQYTGLRGAFSTAMIKTYPGNLVGLLTGFLSYKSTLVPPSVSVNQTIHGIAITQLLASQNAKLQTPIPDLTDYLNLDEPFRCLGWLKEKLAKGSNEDSLPLKDVFDCYQERFGTDKPFGLREFYTVLTIAFPQPPDVQKAAAGSAPLLDVILRNVRYAPEKEQEIVACSWKDCNTVLEKEQDIFNHVVSTHIPNEASSYDCHWKTCTKTQLPRSSALINHLRLHFDTEPTSKFNKKKKSAMKFQPDKLLVDESEVSGVPLTAALLLRELAWNKQHHSYFMPYETELSSLAMQRPKLSKYILTVLAELG